MKVGDSFVTSVYYMTNIYIAAKKVGCKVTRKSLKRVCPETFTTIVEVFLVEPPRKQKAVSRKNS